LFSNAIVCRFRLRPLSVAATGPAAAFSFGPPEQEIIFDATFDARPHDGGATPVQQGHCTSPFGAPVVFTVHDTQGSCADGLRVSAGLRSDPFFIDVAPLKETVFGGRLAFKPVGNNNLAGQNILSIVVEVDSTPLLRASGGPLFAVVGETVVAGKLP